MKLGILVGTRPEIIKMSPLIRRALQFDEIELVLIHSNQHYSESMDGIFFEELNLPQPKYNLNVGQAENSNQIGNIMIKLDPIIKGENLDVLLVQGDTNTVAAGALVASKLGVKIGHVEAGLRSYDRTMPEEGNRIVTDHLSDYLFAVTEKQVGILKGEGIETSKIFKVGNTIVDAVYENLKIAESRSQIIKKLGLVSGEFTLFTAHRAGNVDKEQALKEVLRIVQEIPGKVCWPIHLRTKKNLIKHNLKLPDNVVQCEPLGYFDFLTLENNAKLIVTDSGGLQEEACILGVPCITIRENTERPETVEVGANILIGRSFEKLHLSLNSLKKSWNNPFGDGSTSDQILSTILTDFDLAPISPPTLKREKVVVVGMGYMGVPTAALLANSGYKVTGIDIDNKKVESLNRGELPFNEEGVTDLLLKARERDLFLASVEPVSGDIFIIAVPTPHKNNKCDLSYVLSAVESLVPVLKSGNLLIIESTVKPGTCDKIIKPILDKHGLDIDVVHCPERAIPGNTLFELIHNDRIIGANSESAQLKTEELYKSFVRGEIFKTETINAECSKLMENTFRDVNIALANELSIISDDLGCDPIEVIKLANRHPRVQIHQPGPGVGGHCIPIDPWFLTEGTEKAKLIPLSRKINDEKPVWSVENFLKIEKVPDNAKIGLLGVAYKKDVDDARETPASSVLNTLIEKGYEVKVHDPHIKSWDAPMHAWEEVKDWADKFLVVTDHSIFKSQKYQAKELKRLR
jgi:UDP-N-acetylglucosamine 2-epimerase (non-hydrolysing)